MRTTTSDDILPQLRHAPETEHACTTLSSKNPSIPLLPSNVFDALSRDADYREKTRTRKKSHSAQRPYMRQLRSSSTYAHSLHRNEHFVSCKKEEKGTLARAEATEIGCCYVTSTVDGVYVRQQGLLSYVRRQRHSRRRRGSSCISYRRAFNSQRTTTQRDHHPQTLSIAILLIIRTAPSKGTSPQIAARFQFQA